MRRVAAAAALALLVLPAPRARAGGALPDLTAAAADIELDFDTNVAIGAVAELCAQATSGVDLLRFSATPANVGSANLELGDPMCPDCEAEPGAQCANPDFHCSPAGGHNHAHFTDYARYELFFPSDLVVPVRTGGKFGFCLEDTSCPVGVDAFYDCDFQGITAGCEDLYSS